MNEDTFNNEYSSSNYFGKESKSTRGRLNTENPGIFMSSRKDGNNDLSNTESYESARFIEERKVPKAAMRKTKKKSRENFLAKHGTFAQSSKPIASNIQLSHQLSNHADTFGTSGVNESMSSYQSSTNKSLKIKE